jgi:hypothetical protein
MSEALDAFMATAQRVVYCSLATVDRRGASAVAARARRLGAAGRRRARRLGGQPAVAPMGYDPAPIWRDGPTGDDFVALRLEPWRVQAKSAAAMAAGEPYLVWTRRAP